MTTLAPTRRLLVIFDFFTHEASGDYFSAESYSGINYKEIPKYIRLAENLGIDQINLQKITDWGTTENFDQCAIWKETHDEYPAYSEIIKNIRNERVQLGNIQV